MRICLVVLFLTSFFVRSQKQWGIEALVNRFDVYTQISYIHSIQSNQDITFAIGTGVRSTFAARTLHPSLNIRYNYAYLQRKKLNLIIGGNTLSTYLPVGEKNSTFFNEVGLHTSLVVGTRLKYHLNLGGGVGLESFPKGTTTYLNANLNMGWSYAF
ncbi:hypothetical protein SAMN05216474_0485 [Lishizhenia tianjinensis]|uniref:Uncharacterized protein n=1 Tax=Lishizhenia tianjinensis TaxID=477690 RepID=A0A1I6XWW1_9FLAO|nr:hypothetical protein [Lishizhenia tianjinensis]SFT42391.1 hypothetical protein SAMN05216474_0485 [Lishizhenia tianjinensis]